MDYVRFTRPEWLAVEEESKKEFSETLGGEPTRRTVAKEIADNHGLDLLTRIAIIMLLVVSVFGVFKLGVTAFPLADRMVQQNLHTTELSPLLKTIFQFSVIVSAGFVGVYGMIYFKLVTESSNTERKIVASQRDKKWQVSWWSPRLPYLLVLLTIIIMFIVSNTSNRSVFDWVFNNTVVVLELALSYPVSIWMSKRQARREAISSTLSRMKNVYNAQMEDHETDPRYLRILAQQASEAFFNLRGRGRSRPNEKYRSEDIKVVERIIAEEYRRLRGGVGFSRAVTNWLSDEPQQEVATPIIKTIVNRPAKTTEQKVNFQESDRKPPMGDYWTADQLMADLIDIGAPVPMTEQFINETYAGGHKAREVWRSGLRDMWNN